MEDSEADILNTIPWDKVDIHVFLVEYGGYEYRSEAIKPILLRNNYVLIGTVKEKDFLFVRKDVLGSYDTDLNNFISFYPPKEWPTDIVLYSVRVCVVCKLFDLLKSIET